MVAVVYRLLKKKTLSSGLSTNKMAAHEFHLGLKFHDVSIYGIKQILYKAAFNITPLTLCYPVKAAKL